MSDACSGEFFARRGQAADAEVEYRTALRLEPRYATAAINLADLYRQLNRDAEGESVLRAAIAASPREAAVHHALGLTLTRLKRYENALTEFQTASEMEPDRSQYAYVYAVALHSTGRRSEAMTALRDALKIHPNDRDILSALVSFGRLAGDTKAALDDAERLATTMPGDKDLTKLIEELRRAEKPSAQ